MRLFFFFQRKEAYETLMMHDYGFYRFEQYHNYLGYKDLLSQNKHQGYFENKPIFETRDQFITYDLCYQVTCSCFDFLGYRLKRKDIDRKLGSKLIKPILRYLGFDVPSKKRGKNLESFMRAKLD